MGLISDSDKKKISTRFSTLPAGVKLILFTQEMECQFCSQAREIVEETASTSEKISVEVKDFVADEAVAREYGVDKIPAIVPLAEDGTDYGIRFYGIPSGYEFMSLLEAIEMVAAGDSGLSPESREKIKAVKDDLDLQVFITPTCPYCPRAVIVAFRFAVENPRIRAAMVEATEFPHLANKYQVSGVPHTVIGDSPQPMIGAYPEDAAVDMVLAAVSAK